MMYAPLLLSLAALQDQGSAAPAPAETTPKWTTSLSSFWIEPPNDTGYLSAILYADKGPLHLEARWAYEGRDTGSLSVGKSFPIAGEVSGSITPMLGFAGGDSQGIVPALNLELDWKQLHFSTAVEYLIGTDGDTSDFLYSWSELGWAASERLTLGLVGQRTNIFDEELTVDRGLFVGVSTGRTTFTAYVFNPDLDDPYWTIAIGAGF